MLKRGPNRQLGLRRAWRVAFFLLLVYFFGVRLLVWHTVDRSNLNSARQYFNSAISTQVDDLNDQFEVYADTLYSGRGLFLTDQAVSRQDWTSFVDAQNITQRYPDIYGLSYVTAITRSGVADLTAELNANRTVSERQPVTIFPATADNQLAVVTYIAPETNEQATIGYDLMTDPARAATLTAASSQGVAQATKPIKLISRAGNSSPLGMLLVMPVYKNSQPVATTTERRDATEGYIVLSLHVRQLIDPIFDTHNYAKGLSVRITTAGQTLYRHGPQQSTHQLRKSVQVNAAGQLWRLDFAAPTDFGLGTTAKKAQLAVIISMAPVIVLCCILLYMSLSLHRLHQHHQQHHSGGSDHEH